MQPEAGLFPQEWWAPNKPKPRRKSPEPFKGEQARKVAAIIVRMEDNQQGDEPSEFLQMMRVIQDRGVSGAKVADFLPIFDEYPDPRAAMQDRTGRLNNHYLEPEDLHLGRDLDDLPYMLD